MGGVGAVDGAGRRLLDHLGTTYLQPPRGAWRAEMTTIASAAGRVALTFDDGPAPPATGRTLDVLRELDVQATFFVVGAMAAAHPDLLRRAHDEGHIIGNHSMYHSRTQSLLPGRRRTEHFEAADDAIFQAIGLRPAFYRPPWGWLTRWERNRAQRLGLVPIGWDIDAEDWHAPERPAGVTARSVIDRLGPGSVILLHDATSNVDPCDKQETARAVELIVEHARGAGLEFGRIDEITGIAAYRTAAARSVDS